MYSDVSNATKSSPCLLHHIADSLEAGDCYFKQSVICSWMTIY